MLPTFEGGKDLGRNGSYLVYRQMQTREKEFWAYLRANSASEADAIKLGSKMFGRWPSGAPLALYPDKDPAGANSDSVLGGVGFFF